MVGTEGKANTTYHTTVLLSTYHAKPTVTYIIIHLPRQTHGERVQVTYLYSFFILLPVILPYTPSSLAAKFHQQGSHNNVTNQVLRDLFKQFNAEEGIHPSEFCHWFGNVPLIPC